jgi:TonB-linked SusC/RagA family outer membrane protein
MQIFAQNRTVTGTVTAKDDGGPIPGVGVKVVGTSIGTVTGADGKFAITVPASAKTLQFSFVGYATLDRPISGTVVNAALEVSSKQLGEVVVSSTLGRKVSEKSQGYAATHLTAAETNLTAETNVLNGLTAKVAGLQVSTTGSGVDPGIRITLRGDRSINGNNQALIVVDGMPIPSADISSIDPNTIESTDVLNGGSAGALYGSEASNGVILITTKKGSGSGKTTATYENSFQAQQAYLFPSYQTTYGQYGGEGAPYQDPLTGAPLYVPYENQQYGPAFNGATVTLGAPAGSASGPVKTVLYAAQAKDPRKAFFNTGYTEQNNIGVNSGTADDYFNLSAQNVVTKGIMPNDANQRNSFTVKAGKTYGIFKAGYSLTYTNTQLSQVGSGYNGHSVYYALAQFPANLNIKDFQDPSSTFANPSDFYDSYEVNPYWAVQNSRVNTTKNVFSGNLNLSLTPTKWFDLTYKLADNFGYYEQRQTRAQVNFTAYAASDPLGSGNIPSGYKTTLEIPGTVYDYSSSGDGNDGYSRLQQDIIASLHHTFFNDFKANLLLGSSVYHQYRKLITNSGTNELVQGLYNVNYNAGTPTVNEGEYTINQISFFSDLTLSYKDWAFIDGSLRNDRSSLLVASNRSYYYPAVAGSVIFTDAIPALKDNKILSYGKLRGAYSQTGQVNVNPYTINDVYGVTTGFPYAGLGGLSLGSTHYTTLVPERVTEIEFGTELGFFDNRIHGTATYYKQNSRNQTLGINTSASTGYTSVQTNVGELQSSGYEASLTVSPLTKAKNKFGLDLTANFQNNESKVISLLPNVQQFNISGGGGNEYAIVGQPYPVIQGTDFQKDAQGRTIVSAVNGYPLLNSTLQILGRTTPEYVLGLVMKASYKFITLSATADYRTGAIVENANASSLTFGGITTNTTAAGRQRFVYPNSVYANAQGVLVPNTNVTVQDGNYGFFQSSAYNTATSPLISSSAFWKIREASLSFNLDQYVKKTKYVKGLIVSFTGRNLYTWLPKTEIYGDPELSVDASNAAGYVNINSIPSSRIFGGDVKLTF